VVSWHPHNARKPGHARVEHPAHVLERLAEISDEQEPVVRMMAQRRERRAVGRMTDVQIAEREEPQVVALRTIVVITIRSAA
jgi:hypothetical protein